MKFLGTTFFRKAHRWLGLLVSIQLLMWTASGLFFSIPDITDVRGEQYLTRGYSIDVNQEARENIAPISSIIDIAKVNLEANETVLLKYRAGRLIYQVKKNPPEKKIIFAGIDLISNYLTGDINITSPTGLKNFKVLTGKDLAIDFWNYLER